MRRLKTSASLLLVMCVKVEKKEKREEMIENGKKIVSIDSILAGALEDVKNYIEH